MRIHHLNCGTMCPIGRKLVNGDGCLFARGHMVCHCLLVETKVGLLLVDTGLGTEDVASPRPRLGGTFTFITGARLLREETAFAQVSRLGFAPRDVRHVLPTHLDLDHAGGLGDFPEAKVHIYRPEHDAAMQRRTRREQNRYRPPHWAHGPKWELHEPAGERWFGFEAVRPLPGSLDEVLIVPLVGHTRGHAGIAVRSDAGWLLHAGDAYFFHGEMDIERPRCTPGLAGFQRLVAIDDDARRRNQARLRELVKDHGNEVKVLSAHCPVEFDGYAAEPEAKRATNGARTQHAVG
jgi:glyoxylase-like metal-dependent hydrolase (beta-lactamase superfamily II)